MFRSPGPILFALGPLTIRWYGALMAAAMAVGLWVGCRDAGRRGLDPAEMLKASELGLLGGLIGARLYYVALTWEYYSRAPWKILALWEGGLAIQGGFLGGVLVGGGYAVWKRLPAARYLDVAAPGLALGQAIGDWGTFFNEEAFGTPTDLPWRLYVSPAHRPLRFAAEDFFHPTFLYDSVWDLVVFGLLTVGLRRRLAKAPGALALSYLGFYSFGRLLMEGLRTDPLMLGPIRIARLLGVVGIGVAIVGVLLLLKRARSA